MYDAVESLLDLWESGGGVEVEFDAGDGASKPWQEALEKIAGTRQMDATAIRDYLLPCRSGWMSRIR